MSKSKLFFCVVQDWAGRWGVWSFGGRTKAEEKRFALSGNKLCVAVETDYHKAHKIASEHRQKGE